jgi:deazaflavin-dependent oxidoreductase (nitroreductase family)
VGLLEELGYTVRPPDRLQRTLQRAAARERVSSTLQKTLYPLDKTLHRASSGHHTVASLLTGIPVIMLTTTGARTGIPRTSPLIGIPMAGDLAVIGSNYGSGSTPGWVHNLEANPGAGVAYRDRRVAVMARRATDHETDQAFDAAAAIYAAFPAYRNRADHREIRVFALEAAT